MKIIKRNGAEMVFDRGKIAAAVDKANKATDQTPELSAQQVEQIAYNVENQAAKMARALSVEEIQELVETELMRHSAYETAGVKDVQHMVDGLSSFYASDICILQDGAFELK